MLWFSLGKFGFKKVVRFIMLRIYRSLENENREEAENRKIRYLPDLSIFNLLSDSVLVQRILNYHPNHPTHRFYFGEVETPFLYNEVFFFFF